MGLNDIRVVLPIAICHCCTSLI